MKRFLLASAALAALVAPAAAADLATRYPVKAIAAPVFSWTGFYVGGNVGYGGNKFKFDDVGSTTTYDDGVVTDVDLYSANSSITSSGFFGGGQVGYNYQFANNVVLGAEADIQWTGIKGEYTASTSYWGPYSTKQKAQLDYFGTIRARLGYAFDRFLPYVTGGGAYGKTKVEIVNSPLYDLFDGYSTSATTWGWTVGAGAEYAITNNWTFKTEYLYVDLGSTDYNLVGGSIANGSVSQVNGSADNKFHTVKAGVNYKF